MKYQYCLWLLTLVCTNSLAQQSPSNEVTQRYIRESAVCGGMEAVFKQKGTWKKNGFDDGGGFPDNTFPAGKRVEIMDRLARILPLLQEALPDLGGFSPVWYRSISGNSMVPGGPVPSSFRCLLYPFYCNTNLNKIVLSDEYSGLATITVNGYGSFCKKIDEWDINADGKMISIYQLPDTVGKWKGLTLYEPAMAPGIKDRAVVLVHNGQMPWHTLSQKQYLTGYKNWLESNRKEQLAANEINVKKMKENIANMKASQTLTPEQKKVVVEKLEQQLKEFNDNASQKVIAAAENIYNEKIKPVNQYLDTAAAQTLQQPAVLDRQSNTAFRGYFAKKGQQGIKLICFTSKYFNASLPRYAAQFMVLYWYWGANPVHLKFAKEMEENFPVEKLKALIDQ